MKIDQALFGYEGGHRLLASSIPLGSDASLLTELSDLAPGVIFGSSDSYWTGLPLPSMKKYALLRTWPAPEMSRPGCVWTHVLLLDPRVLEFFEDLSILQDLTKRPSNVTDVERYRHALELPSDYQRMELDHSDSEMVASLIYNLYTQKESVVKTTLPGELVAPLFSVWSQQWPRLRRNFRFQTALSRAARTTNPIRLDITTILAPSADGIRYEFLKHPWVYAACEDISYGCKGKLRAFLQKYGADVKRQKASFKPLVEISLLNSSPSENASHKIFEILLQFFPTLEDAIKLKEDLINGELVPAAQSGLLLQLLSGEDAVGFPMPSSIGLARLLKLRHKHADDLIKIFESAINSNRPVASILRQFLIEGDDLFQTWVLNAGSNELVRLLCRAKPRLVTEVTVNSVADETLIEILPFIAESPNLLMPIMGNLLSRNNSVLVNALLDLAPQVAAQEILTRLPVTGSRPANIWMSELLRRVPLLLNQDVLRSILTTDTLYECVDSLGWLSPAIISSGCAPWVDAVSRIDTRLSTKSEERLAAFFLILGMRTGEASGLIMVERFFDALHSKILQSEIDRDTIEFLSPYLVTAGFFRGWDIGLRLRLSVVTAYVRYKWPSGSFAKLSPRKKTRKMLAEAASEVEEAEFYIDDSAL